MVSRIYIIDDDEAVRDSLKFLLEAHGFSVILFSDGEAFLDYDLKAVSGPVLLDVRMPGRNGLEVLEECLKVNSGLKVIIMSGHADVAMAVMALKKGAEDFVEKPFQSAEFLNAIGRINAQLRSEDQANAICDAFNQNLEKLTPREAQVMEHLVEGKPNKIIAADLGLSVRTIETHRAHLLSKLGIKSISDLVRISLQKTA